MLYFVFLVISISCEALTLKMTTAHEVEMTVTNNSLSKDYPHLDDHAKQTTDIPGFKQFTSIRPCLQEDKVTLELRNGPVLG